MPSHPAPARRARRLHARSWISLGVALAAALGAAEAEAVCPTAEAQPRDIVVAVEPTTPCIQVDVEPAQCSVEVAIRVRNLCDAPLLSLGGLICEDRQPGASVCSIQPGETASTVVGDTGSRIDRSFDVELEGAPIRIDVGFDVVVRSGDDGGPLGCHADNATANATLEGQGRAPVLAVILLAACALRRRSRAALQAPV